MHSSIGKHFATTKTSSHIELVFVVPSLGINYSHSTHLVAT